jgi:hypothetical protein
MGLAQGLHVPYTLDYCTLDAGALIAAATDLTFNPVGYLAVLLNDLLTSLYLIMVKNTPATNGLSTTGKCLLS